MDSHHEISLDIKADGSFSVAAPDLCLHGAYPAFNGIPIRPIAVTVGDSEIRYSCEGGVLTLSFRSEGSALFIDTVLTGFDEAPHAIQPIGNAILSGAERFFRQGQGMGGASGFIQFSEIMEPHQSFTVSGLLSAASSILTVASDDHRRFAQRTLFHNVRHQATAQPVSMIEAGYLTESIPLDKQGCRLPALRLAWAPSIQEGLADCAAYIATGMQVRALRPPSVHWCSWYYHYQRFSETMLDDRLQGFSKLRDQVRVDVIQIDAGYFPSCGDWLETTSDWASGMKCAIRKIKDAGFRAGIWIGPYMVGNRSRLYREHPDWILRDLDGDPVAPWRRYDDNLSWGYHDEETYVLDTSHPDAMAYLRTVFRTFREWGIDFFKTDFMKWGLQDSTKVMRHAPGKTSVEYFRELLEVIRQEIGPDSFWLGCIAPYAPFLGYADAMRIGGDVAPGWSNNPLGFGPLQMIKESQPVQYFNNVWWQNDPDAAFVRDFHTFLSESETQAIALWQGMLGGTLCTSDPLHEVPEWGRELWRFIDLGAESNTAILPFLGCDRKLLVAVRRYDTENAWGLLVLNPTDEPVTEQIALKDAIGIDSAFVHAWGPGIAEPLNQQACLVTELPAHAASLYYLSESKSPPDSCLTLGGARLPFPIKSCQ